MAKRIGQRLEAFRSEQALSQQEIASRLGLPAEWIAAYESGKALPPLLTLWKAAKLLRVRLDSLLADDPLDVPLTNELVIERLRELSTLPLDLQQRVSEFLGIFLRGVTSLWEASSKRPERPKDRQ